MNRNEKISATLFCLTMAILIFFSQKNEGKKESMINENKYLTIAKVFYINSKRNFTDARYIFYYNGIKYESGEYIDNSGSRYMNKYYRVELSKVKPEYSKIFLDQEITDSTEIVNAGFK